MPTGRLRRRAAIKAPASAPAPARVTRIPYAWALRWNSCCAINTLVIWKFKPKVPTKNTTHMTSTMFGLLRMYVRASRICRFARGARGVVRSSRLSIIRSAPINAA